MSHKQILIINASLGGEDGNTSQLLSYMSNLLSSKAKVTQAVLKAKPSFETWKDEISKSSGFVFGTGTYWDSWGSLLQHFLEEATPSETTKLWLGKPAAVVVTAHSVGAKTVLSSLQGVLNTFGLFIPPLCGMAYTSANQLALESRSSLAEDLWRPSDLEVVSHNLLEAVHGGNRWLTWPVDGERFKDRWLSDMIKVGE